ncbi:MAG: twin-arginine translocase TatA/TatE family subunit [Bacteroidales bacterium]|nr:twin-arginine translocase TatA/TatE family subunit [Bacteroidales bacterium]
MMLSILLGVVGGWQVLVIVLVVLLLFGGRKIPELMKGIGQGVKEFKDGISGEAQNKETKDKDATK